MSSFPPVACVYANQRLLSAPVFEHHLVYSNSVNPGQALLTHKTGAELVSEAEEVGLVIGLVS